MSVEQVETMHQQIEKNVYMPQSSIDLTNTQILELYEQVINQTNDLVKNDLPELTELVEEKLQTMAMNNIKTFLEYRFENLENEIINLQSNIKIIQELNKKKIDRLEKKIKLLQEEEKKEEKNLNNFTEEEKLQTMAINGINDLILGIMDLNPNIDIIQEINKKKIDYLEEKIKLLEEKRHNI